MGHGKVEALNRHIRSAFLAELAAAPQITTIDSLNEAFVAWADVHYNRSVHSETGQTPLERWKLSSDRIEYADEEKLRLAFLWREKRTTDKTGIFSLFGCRYQTSAGLARKRIELRYDPEELEEIEVYLDDVFRERVKPFEVSTHRRPRAQPATVPQEPQRQSTEPAANWLEHMMEDRRRHGFDEPPPRQHVEQQKRKRVAADDAIIALLREHLAGDVIDEGHIRRFLDRYGPFDSAQARLVVERLLTSGIPQDIHCDVVLEAIRDDAQRKARA
jgi:hypothetical protein